MEKYRWSYMRNVQQAASEELPKLEYFNQALNDCTLSLLRRKMDTPSVRATFASLLHDYIVDCIRIENLRLPVDYDPEIFRKKLPLLIEGVMVVMYHSNERWDNKLHYNLDGQNVFDLREIWVNQFETDIGGNLLRSALLRYALKNFGEEHKCDIMYYYIERAIHLVDMGQYIDKLGNHYDCYRGIESPFNKVKNGKTLINPNIEKYIQLDCIQDIINAIKATSKGKGDYVELYFKRLYLISSALFRMTAELIMDLLKYKGKERKNIIRYAECYGIMMQVINDAADFVYDEGTIAKKKADVLSDLRNMTITLPMVFHLNHQHEPGLLEAYLEKKDKSIIQGKHNEILVELINSRALSKTIKVGKQLANKAENYIRKDLASSKYLISMLNIAQINRYYFHVFTAKKYLKQGNKYYCEEHLSSLRRKKEEGKKLEGVWNFNRTRISNYLKGKIRNSLKLKKTLMRIKQYYWQTKFFEI